MDVIHLESGEAARKERERIRSLYEAGPEGMLHDLIAAKAVLEKEIALLKELRVMELADLAEPKNMLIANIQVYNGIMRERPQWLERVSDEKRNEIRGLFSIMETLMQETLSYLMKAKRVHHVLLDGIKKGMEKSAQRRSGYNATGYGKPKGGAFSSGVVA
ncbi:MAG: hypothetical protein ABW189_04525 [Rickettsiales bacterium]